MKLKFIVAPLVILTFFLGFTIVAEATLYGPLSLGDFQTLTGTGAEYGPPPAVGFPDGPTTVQSGDPVSLFYGPEPGQEDVEALLFVLSYDPSASSLGGGTIGFQLDSASATFGSGDFFTTGDAGFPTLIEGIGEGEIAGVKFPDAVHAGVVYEPFGGGDTGDPISISMIITSPIQPLRVDIFSLEGLEFTSNPGITQGTIIGNTPNSHGVGVVPEPASMILLGSGLLGLVGFGRKKFFKK